MSILVQKQKPSQKTRPPVPGRSREVSSVPHHQLQQRIGNRAVQRLLQRKTADLDASSASNTSTGLGHDSSPVATVDPIQKKRESGGNLPDEIQTKMENSFGADFSGVRVHETSSLARDLNAKAYTQGNDIHFAPGEYSPGTALGQKILSHELSHVIQHRQGRVRATHRERGHDISGLGDIVGETSPPLARARPRSL